MVDPNRFCKQGWLLTDFETALAVAVGYLLFVFVGSVSLAVFSFIGRPDFLPCSGYNVFPSSDSWPVSP